MRTLYLSSIILFITVQAQSQNRAMPLFDQDTKIVNFLGKKVYQAPSFSPKMNVNVSDFPRGIYIFWLRDQNGKILQSGKFQVIK